LKSLTDDQILTAKEPNRQGRKKITPSENYENIYNRGRDSFRDLKQIVEILEDIEKYAHRFKNARKIIELFGPEKFEPILEHIFQITKSKGAPYTQSYMSSWDAKPTAAPYTRSFMISRDTKPTSSKIKLANYLLSLASTYLMQSFSEEKSKYLHSRIHEVLTELENNLSSFDTIKELEDQIEWYQEYKSYFIPTSPRMDSDRYNLTCKYCGKDQLGKTVEDAITKLKHTEKCKAKDLIKDINIDEIYTWYAIIPPKDILERFEFFNEKQH